MKLINNQNVRFGALWIGGVILFFFVIYHSLNPFENLLLMMHRDVAPGVVTEATVTWDNSNDDASEDYTTEYEYQTPDGRTFQATSTANFTGKYKADDDYDEDTDPPRRIRVEYLPEIPSISRIKGLNGSVLDGIIWVTFTAVILALLFGFGIFAIKIGIRESKGEYFPVSSNGSDMY